MIIDENGEVSDITEEDFKRARKNPYAEILNREGTILIDAEILEYFKELAQEKNIHYENLISTALKDYIINIK